MSIVMGAVGACRLVDTGMYNGRGIWVNEPVLMSRLRSSTAGLSLVYCLAGVTCSNAWGQSLEETLASAYTHNPQLLEERYQLEITDENVPQALSNWRPTVSATALKGFSHQSYSQNNNAAATSTLGLSPETYSLTVSQPLYRGGQTVAQTEQAENQVKYERAHLISVEQTVLLTAITDYLEVYAEQRIVDYSKDNENVLRRQRDTTLQRVRLGELAKTDQQQAEASYAQATANLRTAEGQLESYRAAFEHDVGMPAGMLPPVSARSKLPDNLKDALDLAIEFNPDIISAAFNEAAAKANLRLVEGRLLPEVSLQGVTQRSREASNVANQWIRDDEVSVQLSVPLYEGGLVYSQSRAAGKNILFSSKQLDDARLLAVQAATQAWHGLMSARAAEVALRASISAGELALRSLEEETKVGTRSLQDVLFEQQTLYQTRVSLAQSERDEIIYEFTLAKAIGRLSADQLNVPVELYDPTRDYNEVRDKWFGFGTATKSAKQ